MGNRYAASGPAWAFRYKDGLLAFDRDGRAWVYFSRRDARAARKEAEDDAGEPLKLVKLEIE